MFKLHKSPSYVEKLHYLDFQIENLMRSMAGGGGQAEDLQKELKRVRAQIIANQMKLNKKNCKK